MIRKDFFEGGFPISRRSPVICTNVNSFVVTKDRSTICYNRFELKATIEVNGIVSCSCVGIWPGKKTTDGFILSPSHYLKTPLPPEEHKDIDSAESITVVFHTDNTFYRLLYTPGAFATNQTPIMSQDKALYEYVKTVGLKFSSVIEK
jgi:hypothetical protein